MDQDAFESDAPAAIEKMLLRPTDVGSAVVQRTTVKVRPQGSSIGTDVARTLTYRITGSDYADLSTLTWNYKLTRSLNGQIPEDLHAITAIGDIRLEAGSVEVESIRNVGQCLKPLIYAGVSRQQMEGPLTQAGAYKYVPTFNGLMAMNSAADTTDSGDIAAPQYTGAVAGKGVHNWTGQLAVATDPASTMAAVNSVIRQRFNSPYMPCLAHPLEYVPGAEAGNLGPDAFAGLDVGAAGIKVPLANGGTSTHVTAQNNYTSCNVFGKCVLPNSMPIHEATEDGAATSNDGGSATLLAGGPLTRDYSLDMKLILGFCRLQSFVPIRNLGSLTLTIELAPYAQQFIHVIPMTQDSESNVCTFNQDIRATATNSRQKKVAALLKCKEYTIHNTFLQYDAVRASDAVVARVDEMCSSSSGYSIPYETMTSLTTPFAYSEQVSFTHSRAFSKLKDVYISFQDQATSTCPQLSKSDYALGSRYLSSSLSVGQQQYPLVDIESPSEAYSELMKAFSHMGTQSGSVVDRKTWMGERSNFAENQFSVAGMLPDITLATANNEGSLRMASGLNTQAPSCALWAHSLERVLGKSAPTYGSGINTRAQGFSVSSQFKFKAFADVDWKADSTSLLNPRYLDCHLGQADKMLCRTVFHVDGLLRIVNDAVEVSM